MVHGLIVPAFSDIGAICAFAKDVRASDRLILDFSRVGFARPTGMLLLASIISQAVNEGKIVGTAGIVEKDYPANMGFYSACNIDTPKSDASGGATYYPLTMHQVAPIKEAAARAGKPVGEQINFMVGRLAFLIVREARGNLFEAVKYCLREILRNVVEHSESREFLVMGQYWPTTNDVELAVLDSGIGIRKGLLQNPALGSLNSDLKAIRLALLPSISGKKVYTAALEIDRADALEGVWGNSGFGLYMTSITVAQSDDL